MCGWIPTIHFITLWVGAFSDFWRGEGANSEQSELKIVHSNYTGGLTCSRKILSKLIFFEPFLHLKCTPGKNCTGILFLKRHNSFHKKMLSKKPPCPLNHPYNLYQRIYSELTLKFHIIPTNMIKVKDQFYVNYCRISKVSIKRGYTLS